jgi:hypothetical protein
MTTLESRYRCARHPDEPVRPDGRGCTVCIDEWHDHRAWHQAQREAEAQRRARIAARKAAR